MTADLPVIDISVFRHAPTPADGPAFPSAAQREVGQTIDSALRHQGCFILRGFGLKKAALSEMFRATTELFGGATVADNTRVLPSLSRTSDNVGYIPPDGEMLNPGRGISVESKEAFNFRFASDVDPQWRQDFSGCPASYEPAAKALWDNMTCDVLPTLCLALETALGTPRGYFVDMLAGGVNSTLRSLYYRPSGQEPGTVLAAEHTDFGFVTLLFTDALGLQAQPVAGGELKDGLDSGWVDVPVPAFGEAIVNAGAMMGRVTNDYWPALAHRVVDSPGVNGRRSVVCFFEPPKRKVLRVMDRFRMAEKKGDTVYEDEMSAGEYLKKRLLALNPPGTQNFTTSAMNQTAQG